MKTYSFYHAETGVLHPDVFFSTNPDTLPANTPVGHVAIEGMVDALSQRFDLRSKQIVDYQPPQPSSKHEWNKETKRWQLNSAASAVEESRTRALNQIAALEQSQNRIVREHLLGDASALERLAQIDNRIAELRKELSQ